MVSANVMGLRKTLRMRLGEVVGKVKRSAQAGQDHPGAKPSQAIDPLSS